MTGMVDVARRPARFAREHPFAVDTAGAVVLTVLAVVVHATSTSIERVRDVTEPAWWTVPLVVAASLPVMFRRRAPVAALAVVLGGQILCEANRIAGPSWIAVLVGTYSLGAYAEGTRRLRAVVGFLTAVVTILVLGFVDDQVTALDAVALLGILTAAFAVGDNLRRRRANIADLADRAERAERERDLLARERVAEERNRIARELHDIVAHSVSVMVIQASAARRNLDARPADAVAMLENVERTGRQAMDELRQVLGVLRDKAGEPDAMPVPTLADLPTLVGQVGPLPVRLAVTGMPERVPAGIAVSVYRIVQEALTNANRHAGPTATVDVRVTCSASDVQVVVADDGRGASTASRAGGYGLVGMHERATAAGGTLHVGPRTGGGWRVAATIPYQPGTLRAAAPSTSTSTRSTSTRSGHEATTLVS